MSIQDDDRSGRVAENQLYYIFSSSVQSRFPPVVKNDIVQRPFKTGGFYGKAVVGSNDRYSSAFPYGEIAAVRYREYGTVIGYHVHLNSRHVEFPIILH